MRESFAISNHTKLLLLPLYFVQNDRKSTVNKGIDLIEVIDLP